MSRIRIAAFSRTAALTGAIAGTLAGAFALPARAARAQVPASAPATAPATGQTIAGVVHGAGRTVVVGAQVVVTPLTARGGPPAAFARSVVTDDGGRFRVPGLPTGPVTVSIKRIGFKPVALDTAAPAAPELTFTLEPIPQRLAAVVVRERRRTTYTGRMADFNRRRDMGFGRFITAADIDNRHPLYTTDMLRMIPGLTVYPSGIGSPRLRIRGEQCDPLIWLDGMPALSGYLDVDAFEPSSLAGIEVYSGVATVPVELRGPRGEERCGVIALWSRVPEPGPRRSGKTYTAADLQRLVEAATVYTADQVDAPAHLDSTATLAVSYPDSLRNTHTPGEVTVEFVVDTTGAVEPGTVGVVAASHPGFTDAARVAAAGAKFVPAERAGRTVRQLVQLPLKWEAGR